MLPEVRTRGLIVFIIKFKPLYAGGEWAGVFFSFWVLLLGPSGVPSDVLLVFDNKG